MAPASPHRSDNGETDIDLSIFSREEDIHEDEVSICDVQVVEVNLHRPELNRAKGFKSNHVKTAKYTWYNAIPLSLFFQFYKASNVFFLFVMTINLIPGASPINPLSSLIPFTIVVGAGMLKDIWIDLKRQHADRLANRAPVSVLRRGEFVSIPSSDVFPGDIMLFRVGEEIKADCVVLNTSLPEGLMYIDTANLDGESNAKARRAKKETVTALGTVEDIEELAHRSSAEVVRPQENEDRPELIESLLPSASIASSVGVNAARLYREDREDSDDFSHSVSEEGLESSRNKIAPKCPPGEEDGVKKGGRGPISFTTTGCQTMGGSGDSPSQGNTGAVMGGPMNGIAGERLLNPAMDGILLVSSPPNPDLSNWIGKICFPTREVIGLSIDQFLPRGCILRNTDWILAAVIFAGSDTKVILNHSVRREKVSVMLKRLNYLNLILFCIYQTLVITLCGMAVVFKNANSSVDPANSTWYMHWQLTKDSTAQTFGWRYLTNFVLFAFLIPLSLYVTLEFNKAMQAVMIGSDLQMAVKDEYLGKVRYAKPKTAELNSELAHVRFIFTDKTGTLTENLMTYVEGYADGIAHDEVGNRGGLGCRLLSQLDAVIKLTTRHAMPLQFQPPSVIFRDKSKREGLSLEEENNAKGAQENDKNLGLGPRMVDKPEGSLAKKTILGSVPEQELEKIGIFRYLRALSLCHSILCFDAEDLEDSMVEDGDPSEMASQASLNIPLSNDEHSEYMEHVENLPDAYDCSPKKIVPANDANIAGAEASKTRRRLLMLETQEPNLLLPSVTIDPPAQQASAKAELVRADSEAKGFNEAFQALSRSPEADARSRETGTDIDSDFQGSSTASSVKAEKLQEPEESRLKKKSRPPALSLAIPSDNLTPFQPLSDNETFFSAGNSTLKRGRGRPFFATHTSMSVKSASTSNLGLHTGKSSSMHLHGRSSSASWYYHQLNKSMKWVAEGGGASPNPLQEFIESGFLYEGQSLDEVALVNAARENGFSLMERSNRSVLVKMIDTPRRYTIIAENEFSSQRKLMSILLKRDPEGDDRKPVSQREVTKSYHRSTATSGPSPLVYEESLIPPSEPALPLSKHVDPAVGVNDVDFVRKREESEALTQGALDEYEYDDEVTQMGEKYLLLIKGADSSMLDIVDNNNPRNIAMLAPITDHLDACAKKGFRTLLLGQRYVGEDEVRNWLPFWEQAMSAMVNRSERLHEAYARIERKVELVGSTCVEDKLQEDVSETLQFFRSASIVVWMLTGDKRETAVNIAVSAGLILDSEDTVVHLEVKSTDPFSDPYNSETSSISSMSMSASTAAEDVGGSLPSHNLCLRRQARAQLEEQLLDAHETIKETTSLDGKAAVVLVVDGFTLGTIFEEETALEKFFDISCRCRSAICCRMTPAQKAEVVRMFKKHTKQVTLAIGDGANDVPMIQASSIGIGIMGLEGSQAELCSDYAIPKFRFLKRLLMVHGRYSLYRDAHCILYSIYKNVFITVGMIGYSFYCGFSGQTFIDSWYLALFSVAFCAIQPMLVGILDKDVSEELAESVPQLYPPLSREKMYFSAPYIFKWLSDGFIEGVFSFLVLIYFFATPENIYNGRTGCLFDYGMFFFTALVLVTNIRVSIQLAYHNLLISGVMVLMFISAPVVEILYSQFKSFAGSDTMVYVADEAYSSSMLYIYLLAAVGIFLVYTLSSHLYIQLFAPWKNARFAVLAARESPFHSVFEEKRKQLSSEYEQRLKYQEECRKKVMY